MAQTVTLKLPEEIYECLKRAAEALQQPIETVLVQVVQAGLPPSVDDVPPEYREEFQAMARLSDQELWDVAQSTLPKAKQLQLSRLLRKNEAGTLSEKEHRKLEALHREADLITLRKAHAYALLKWRNRRIPTLDELHKG
jgi:hypothetical protein